MQLDLTTNRYQISEQRITLRNYKGFNIQDLVFSNTITAEDKRNIIEKERLCYGDNDKAWDIEQSVVDTYIDLVEYVKNHLIRFSRDKEYQ